MRNFIGVNYMVFSKTQREFLKRLEKRDRSQWIKRTFALDEYVFYFGKYYKDVLKKHNYYSQMKSRIKKKVKQMKADIELYNRVEKFLK